MVPERRIGTVSRGSPIGSWEIWPADASVLVELYAWPLNQAE